MGHVVSFTPRPDTGNGRILSAGDAGAIIIFPGVRYERVPEAEKPASSNAAARTPKH